MFEYNVYNLEVAFKTLDFLKNLIQSDGILSSIQFAFTALLTLLIPLIIFAFEERRELKNSKYNNLKKVTQNLIDSKLDIQRKLYLIVSVGIVIIFWNNNGDRNIWQINLIILIVLGFLFGFLVKELQDIINFLNQSLDKSIVDHIKNSKVSSETKKEWFEEYFSNGLNDQEVNTEEERKNSKDILVTMLEMFYTEVDKNLHTKPNLASDFLNIFNKNIEKFISSKFDYYDISNNLNPDNLTKTLLLLETYNFTKIDILDPFFNLATNSFSEEGRAYDFEGIKNDRDKNYGKQPIIKLLTFLKFYFKKAHDDRIRLNNYIDQYLQEFLFRDKILKYLSGKKRKQSLLFDVISDYLDIFKYLIDKKIFLINGEINDSTQEIDKWSVNRFGTVGVYVNLFLDVVGSTELDEEYRKGLVNSFINHYTNGYECLENMHKNWEIIEKAFLDYSYFIRVYDIAVNTEQYRNFKHKKKIFGDLMLVCLEGKDDYRFRIEDPHKEEANRRRVIIDNFIKKLKSS